VDDAFVNVVNAEDGLHLWGIVRSPEQLAAARIAAETAAGGVPVVSHLSTPSGVPWAAIWI